MNILRIYLFQLLSNNAAANGFIFISKVVEENKEGGPSAVNRALGALKADDRRIIPSLKENPQQVGEYLKWIEQTQGPISKQNIISAAQKQQQMNRLRSGVIP